MRPENSLAAFQAACAGGVGIELDVQLTADGEAVVFHDHDLDRMTTESGLVEERTAEDLSHLMLLGGERQTIPLLADALAVIAGRTLVLVELKTAPGQEGPLEARTAALLETYEGPAAVLSFSGGALAAIKRADARIVTGLNRFDPPSMDELTSIAPDFLSINKRLADDPKVLGWRANGGAAIAWTVRSAAEEDALRGRVDNIVFEGFAP
jgi:glycerophosphoryl diester phosphodiesterase